MLFATLVCVAWFGVCLNVLHFSGTTITHHYSISIEHKSKSRRRDRYLCVACRPHTRPQRFSPRRRELARAPQTHHTHRKPRHPTLASRSKRECAPLQHAAHMTQAMSSFTSTHHVASNAHKAPRNAPGTLSRPSRAHSNAPIPAQ